MAAVYEIEGQVMFFRFETEDALMPEAYSATVLDDLRRVAKTGPVGLMATISTGVKVVNPTVLAYWLKNVQDRSLRISAIAVVSQRLAIRIAVQSFSQAAKVLGVNLEMRCVSELAEARAWLQERLTARAATG